MAKADTVKRSLEFQNLDEMLAEAQSLLDSGYIAHGNWTLGQACGHLADWMQFPLDGYPKPPLFIRVVFGMMRMTGASRRMKEKILTEGFKGGMATAPDTVPNPQSTTDEQGVERLRKAVDRVKKFEGELQPSPLFGEMDREMHIRISLLHAAHHLIYLEPVR